MNGILFNRFKCFREISKYHHFRFTSVPGVIIVRVFPTAKEERISLIKTNVDLNDLLTSMPNIFNSGGLSEERKLYSDMPRSHIHGLDAGLATDTIRHHPWQSVLVRSFPYCIRNHTR